VDGAATTERQTLLSSCGSLCCGRPEQTDVSSAWAMNVVESILLLACMADHGLKRGGAAPRTGRKTGIAGHFRARHGRGKTDAAYNLSLCAERIAASFGIFAGILPLFTSATPSRHVRKTRSACGRVTVTIAINNMRRAGIAAHHISTSSVAHHASRRLHGHARGVAQAASRDVAWCGARVAAQRRAASRILCAARFIKSRSRLFRRSKACASALSAWHRRCRR